MSLWKTYFAVARPAQPADVTPNLWNDEATVKAFYEHDEKYQAAVMEQYKLYVEMTDRISNRRGLTNTFFLTLHSAVLTVVAVFWKDRPEGVSPWFLLPVLVLVLGLCLAWFWLVRSYRQLNSGKFAVVGALEQRLPASPWWGGEWKALRGDERDKSTYWALTHLEIWIPLLFALAYIFGVVAAISTS
jgi:F0F1-type ATP synthase assembly protein I